MPALSRGALELMAAMLLIMLPSGLHAQTTLDQLPPLPPLPAEVQGTPSLPPDPSDAPPRDDNLAQRVLVSPREPRCVDNGEVGGIQVCGKKKDNSTDRLPITGELNSATATGDGLPRAPDVMGNRISGHSMKFTSCLIGGCPRAAMPDINFSLMPADPAGSDADRIGRGEIRGN